MPEEPTSLAGKLIDVRSRFGIGIGILYLLHKLLLHATRGAVDLEFHRLFIQPVRSEPVLPIHLAGSLVVRQIGPEDPAIAEALSRADDLPRRLERGDRCIAAFRDGRRIGYLWLCFGPFDEVDSRCRFVLPDGKGAWDYDMFVTAEERGGPAFPALWDAAWRMLRDCGVLWTASRISGFNDVSLRSHLRLGARPVGWLLLIRMGRCLALTGSVRPRFKATCRATGFIEVNFRTGPD
jgi:hypothetical protein